MKLPKTTLLLLTATLLFFMATVFLLFRNNQQINPPTKQTPTGSQQLTITDSRIASSSASKKEVTDPLVLTFSFPLTLEDIVISVVPPTVINIDLNTDQNQLTITPANTWNYATKYTIKILKSTKSQGKQLDKDYSYQFETKPYQGL